MANFFLLDDFLAATFDTFFFKISLNGLIFRASLLEKQKKKFLGGGGDELPKNFKKDIKKLKKNQFRSIDARPSLKHPHKLRFKFFVLRATCRNSMT